MSLLLKCKCGGRLKAPVETAGKRAQCKHCGFKFTVPSRTRPSRIDNNLGVAGSAPPGVPADDIVTWLSQHIEAPSTESDFNEKEPPSGETVSPCTKCGKAMRKGGIVCMHCGYHSQLGRQLKTFSSAQFTASENTAKLASVSVSLLVIVASYYAQQSMEGRTFLAFYFGCFCVLGVLTPLLRKIWVDSDVFNYASLFVLLGIGCVRIAVSISAGRYKLSFLLLGMVAAATVFLWARTNTENEKCNVFSSPSGGLSLPRYSALCAVSLLAVGAVFFLPVVSSAVGFLGILVPSFVGVISLGGLFATGWGGYSGASSFGTSSSFGSSSSFGGGCGGCGG